MMAARIMLNVSVLNKMITMKYNPTTTNTSTRTAFKVRAARVFSSSAKTGGARNCLTDLSLVIILSIPDLSAFKCIGRPHAYDGLLPSTIHLLGDGPRPADLGLRVRCVQRLA